MVDIRLKNGPESSLFSNTFKEHEVIFTNDTNQVFIQYNNNKILVSNCLIGAILDRPTAGIRTRMYYASDSKELYIDDGNIWILISSSPNRYVVKEFFTYTDKPNSGGFWGNNTNNYYGNYRVADNIDSYCTIRIPNDFNELLKIEISCIGKNNSSANKIDIYTYYAHSNHSYNEYAKTLSNISFPIVTKQIDTLDITDCIDINYLQKNMFLGIKTVSDNTLRYLGVRFVYRGVLSYDL